MQREYGQQGLVCMSVTVGETSSLERSLEFLTQKNATFPNFLLDEEVAFWQDRWKVSGPPAVFVFDRSGRRAARFDADDPDKPFKNAHAEIEKLVKELLATP
jgi:hypothetical protein